MIINKLKRYIKYYLFRKKYIKKNKNNFTIPKNCFSLDKVDIGNYTYGEIEVREYGLEEEKLTIGSFCSIADDVVFFLAGEHSYNRVSTYPFKTKILNLGEECLCKGKIVVEDDVWIGHNVTILSGVTIGKGAIIGAGSVVAKDIPPYAIYANGRIVKYRFDEKIIKKLIKINYNNLNYNKVKTYLDDLYENITEENVEDIIKKISEEK